MSAKSPRMSEKVSIKSAQTCAYALKTFLLVSLYCLFEQDVKVILSSTITLQYAIHKTGLKGPLSR